MVDVHRGLHDHVLRVVGLRGDSDLVDPNNRDSSREGHRGVSFVGDHTDLGSVNRERASVLDVVSQGI